MSEHTASARAGAAMPAEDHKSRRALLRLFCAICHLVHDRFGVRITEGEIVTPTLLPRRFTLGHILAGGTASVAAIATPLIRACRRASRVVRPPVLSPRGGVGTGRD